MKLPDDGKRYELIEGELEPIPRPNVTHGIITSRLLEALRMFLRGQGQSPDLALTNLAFELDSKSAPLPDVAYVTADKMVGIDLSKAFPGPPDFAIEVMSPSDKWSVVSKKVKLYQIFQTKLVWVVDPFDDAVNVYQLGRPRQLLLIGAELDATPILPGFKFAVKDLFN